MIMTLLRAVSLTFAHAIWTGIFAYYLARAYTMHNPWTVYVCLGFGVSIVLHGTYNWLWSIQPGYTALIVGISFVLFYIYLTNIRQCAESPEKYDTSLCDEPNTQQLTTLEK
jgi:RsiW-degrading membrane proteinase PrsW (M82 family)